MANLSYETSVVVEAPADVIYDYVADFPRHVEWCHQPQKMVPLTEGPIGVGSQFQTYEQGPSNMRFGQKVMFGVAMPVMKLMYGAQDYTVAEITALEPNKRVAWKAWAPSTKKGDMMRMNWEIRLRPNGNGTEVEQHCEVAPPPESPLARMVNEDMATQSREEVSTNLQRLKSIVEGQSTNR
jgi:uncharacterized membrane protein